MLGAIYGATTGTAAVLMPRLTRAYPRAIALVEAAPRAGRARRRRVDPARPQLAASRAAWQAELAAASADGAGADDVARPARRGRDWGRFTRNFVVQGTAAEWALCWMASLRRRLAARSTGGRTSSSSCTTRSWCTRRRTSPTRSPTRPGGRREAGRLLFGDTPVDFPLTVAVVDAYDQAK